MEVNTYHKNDGDAWTYGIRTIHCHPDHSEFMHQDGSPGYTADIAILELYHELPWTNDWRDGVRPVCLPNKPVHVDDNCDIAGWGGRDINKTVFITYMLMFETQSTSLQW